MEVHRPFGSGEKGEALSDVHDRRLAYCRAIEISVTEATIRNSTKPPRALEQPVSGPRAMIRGFFLELPSKLAGWPRGLPPEAPTDPDVRISRIVCG